MIDGTGPTVSLPIRVEPTGNHRSPSGDCKFCMRARTIMSSLTILQTYAQKAPESLPSSILFKHSSKNITIFDGYPKSIFHFLILPRIQKPDPVLSNLGTLLNSGDKVRAKEVITSLWEDAQVVKKEILDEMVTRYGFKWDIWTGFHGAPSMEYVFLIVNAMVIDTSFQTSSPSRTFFRSSV